MVSTSSIPGFIGPPEFRGRGRTVGRDGGGNFGGGVPELQQELRAGAGTGIEIPAPGEANNGIGRAMTGQIFGQMVSAMAQSWKAGEAPEPYLKLCLEGLPPANGSESKATK